MGSRMKSLKTLIWKMLKSLEPERSKWSIQKSESQKKWPDCVLTVNVRLEGSMGL